MTDEVEIPQDFSDALSNPPGSEFIGTVIRGRYKIVRPVGICEATQRFLCWEIQWPKEDRIRMVLNCRSC